MTLRAHQGDTVEIHLEELGQRSWLKAAANTLLGNTGSAQFRFVARPAVAGRPDGQDASVAPDAVGRGGRAGAALVGASLSPSGRHA